VQLLVVDVNLAHLGLHALARLGGQVLSLLLCAHGVALLSDTRVCDPG